MALALAASSLSAAGCAIGSGDAADGGASPADTEPHLLDEGVRKEDTAFPPDAELEDVTTTPDSATPVPETSPIFDVDPDGCSATCTVCGAVDGCGGKCKIGSCTGASDVCVDGVCKCAPKCTTCGGSDGCGGTCKTGTCAGSAACVAGTCVVPTKSYLSPSSYPVSWGAFAKGISWTIASEGASKIFYTIDGSAPNGSSAGGASPLTLFLPTDGTPLKWYADNGAKEVAQSFTVQISTALQTGYGYVVDGVKLDGASPTVVVSPGAVLNGNAKYQAWVSTACPGCRQQLVYGIGTTAMGCLYDWSPSTWPGATGTATTRITAPATSGVHKVRVAWALQLSCSDAMTIANPLGVKPTADIATIVVK